MKKELPVYFEDRGLLFPPFKGAWDFGFCSKDCSAILTFHKGIISKNFCNSSVCLSSLVNPVNFQNSIIDCLGEFTLKQLSRLPVETSLRPAFFVFYQDVNCPLRCRCRFTYDISLVEKHRGFGDNKIIFRVKFVK